MMTMASGTVSRIERSRASAACNAVSSACGLARVEGESGVISTMMSGNEHRRTLQATVAQIGQCLVGTLQRVNRGGRAHARLAGDCEELHCIGAREVGHRENVPFLP